MPKAIAMRRWTTAVLVVMACIFAQSGPASAKAPPIRLSDRNQVPACVTPERLMLFLATRNKKLLPKFRDIAEWYKYHGESWRVRWDYAFYQMAIETNFLTYRTPSGRWGDVKPKQNNFAGIGTTGGGVPGNSFKDVGTGVLAQIQHLVVYSGERVPKAVAYRTRSKQHIILKLSKPIARRRPVTFQDLSGRWAVDRRYGRSIQRIARLFAKKFCTSARQNPVRRKSGPPPSSGASAEPTFRPAIAAHQPSAIPATAKECRVQIASYGGSKTLLIKSIASDVVQLTALDVHPGSETEMARNFSDVHAPGGTTIAEFDSRDSAVNKAHAMCKQMTTIQ